MDGYIDKIKIRWKCNQV